MAGQLQNSNDSLGRRSGTYQVTSIGMDRLAQALAAQAAYESAPKLKGQTLAKLDSIWNMLRCTSLKYDLYIPAYQRP